MPVGEPSRPYVVCPVCGHVFRSTYASTYITIGREADLCPQIPGRPPAGARLFRRAGALRPAPPPARARGAGGGAEPCPEMPGRPSGGGRWSRSAVAMCPVGSFAAGEAFDDLGLTFD